MNVPILCIEANQHSNMKAMKTPKCVCRKALLALSQFIYAPSSQALSLIYEPAPALRAGVVTRPH